MLWEYDQESNSWTRKTDFIGSARNYAVSFTLNDTGYVGTGFDGSYLSDFYRYIQATDSWQAIPI